MASDLLTTCLQLHTLNFDPSGSPGKSFHGRRIGPKLEKARRVLQFGSWTGFVQRGIVSNVYAIRDFIWYSTQNAHFVWVMALLVSFAQCSWAWEAVARKFYPLIFQLYWQFTAFAILKTSEATPMLLLGFHQTFPLGSGALEVSGVLVKRRWDLQRWPYIHNFAFNESCVYLKTYFLFTNRWHVLLYS